MKISVVIVTKNRKDFLLRALNSVLAQTVKADEIVIVDDASDYNIKEIIESLAIKNLKLIINNKSVGGAVARNIGAAATDCEIIMFLDDDDAWENIKIQKQIEIFKNEINTVLVYSGRKIVNENNLNNVVRKITSKEEGDLSKKIFEKNFVGVTSSVAIRKNIFDKVAGFDKNLPCRQDYDLWIRILKFGNVRWDKCYNIFYTLFNNPEKQISGRADKHEFAVKYILDKYSNELNSLGLLLKQKSISEKYFSVAKAYRRRSWQKGFKFSFKSFINYPNIKAIILIFPRFILKRFGI